MLPGSWLTRGIGYKPGDWFILSATPAYVVLSRNYFICLPLSRVTSVGLSFSISLLSLAALSRLLVGGFILRTLSLFLSSRRIVDNLSLFLHSRSF